LIVVVAGRAVPGHPVIVPDGHPGRAGRTSSLAAAGSAHGDK
jgi:hypothetical protein